MTARKASAMPDDDSEISGTISDITGTISDPLPAKYEEMFRNAAFKAIAAYEQAWIQAGIKDPALKPYFDLQLSELRSNATHVPGISREGAAFLRATDKAQYEDGKDGLAELDISLARREQNFCRILVAAVLENYRIARLVRAQGRVGDLTFTLLADSISRSCLTVGQLAGDDGYLINPPELAPVLRASSETSNGLARSIVDASRSIKRSIPGHLVRFMPRYLLGLARRNYVRLVVTVGVFGWLFAVIAEVAGISPLTLFGVAFVAAGALGPNIFERISKRRSLELHRRAVHSATTALYLSFVNFVPERAFLDTMLAMSDEERLRELFPR